ncbi:MAG TPA: DNA integrity scanning diadenylate cyclase DisA [Candidatus Omnitrophota bacterium]|nr:DNA integrity scanning diadenylate cyclase DisA [Candidatus Omnitrophota bacterium]
METRVREVQKKITDKENRGASEEEFLSVLKLIVPGTNFRAALDGALKVGKGALIVVDNGNTFGLFEGGFRINTNFTPQKLVELTKMDGAIILSKDTKKINYANVLLTPNSRIKTNETGTRHKAAERTAKQAGTLVVAISERRSVITIYYKDIRYSLISTDELLRKTNEHLQLLEKQRELFDNYSEKLIKMDLKNYFNLNQAIQVIQKGKLIQKIAADLRRYSIELGKEGTLLRIRLKEILSGVEKETDLIIRDYAKLELDQTKLVLNALNYEEILDENTICQVLGYENPNANGSIKGWHILMRTFLSEIDADLVIGKGENWEKIVNADNKFFIDVIGEEKAETLYDNIEKMKLSFTD